MSLAKSIRYTSAGLWNTQGKQAKSATLNGKACTRNGISPYWDCTGFSSALSGNSDLVVTYEVEVHHEKDRHVCDNVILVSPCVSV